MCGIVGFAGFASMNAARRRAVAMAMTDSLRHRGPDDGGVFIDPGGGVALGHRRLKIIDLSEAAHQPMASSNGRYAIAYNGEIYNFHDLRRRLDDAGVVLRSQSDTEVLLEWVVRWGLRSALDEAEGMFAFALWDRAERRLSLARDHAGIKPLFWSRQSGGLLFASELKALARFPQFRPDLDPAALGEYLRFGYVTAPRTIFAGTHKLPPGHILVATPEGEPRLERYWDPAAGFAAPRSHRSEAEAGDELLHLVRRAVRQEMIADVPVGTFLSGGVDSSLITALARETAPGELRTYSIRVADRAMDESGYAAAVAQHLGTTHTEVELSPADAAAIIRDLPQIYDEPLSDMAQIPTRLISATARKSVTVALSGDGGDEVFAGYQRYADALARARHVGWLPGPVARAFQSGVSGVPPGFWQAAERASGGRLQAARLEHLSHRLSELLQNRQPMDIYLGLLSLWPQPPLLDDGKEAAGLPDAMTKHAPCPDDVARFQLIDMSSYLPDAILTKLDRASMAVGLESRVPLLNRRLIEFAQGLPLAMRQRDGVGKPLLREVLYKLVPRALVDRPKQGFSVPMAAWLRGPLRDWADDLLSPQSLATPGMLYSDPIIARWSQHRAGLADWSYSLWAILVLLDWWRVWRAPAAINAPVGEASPGEVVVACA